jgi:protein-S-isoprenylcysteine O-methyltransferase Ste14
MADIPLTLLTATIWAYWIRVGVMVVRARRRDGHLAGLVPRQRLERLMWIVWVPLVAAWMVLPLLGLTTRTTGALAVPLFAREQPVYAALRWAAAAGAIACLLLTLQCWARMGRAWRMSVAPDERTELITDGLFARIRHPIYSLSMGLMVCSAVIVATLPMLVVAVVHLVLMNLKARNEERHLLSVQAAQYEPYLQRTGRFVPRCATRAR